MPNWLRTASESGLGSQQKPVKPPAKYDVRIGLALLHHRFKPLSRWVTKMLEADNETAYRQEDWESRFRELLENVHLIAIMLDVEGRITFCNSYLLQLTGW